MNAAFYASAMVALVSALMVITRRNAVHALLYLVVCLLAVALLFFLLGAAFAAALEVIVYAGAIVVLFVFVVMLLNVGHDTTALPQSAPRTWLGPALLALPLLVELVYLLLTAMPTGKAAVVGPQAVGRALFGPRYLLAVELASLLLLAALVGALHLARISHRPSAATVGSPAVAGRLGTLAMNGDESSGPARSGRGGR